ncbi:MAG: radical SAM protein, partial [Candidatus Omnitrophota bacterium]|nr:radical SAM protein [Candidatus Omnitrophota bacterium]
MKKINWDNFKNDDEALEYLISLPRYKNNTIKSALSRALFFLSILYCRIFRVDKPVFIVLVTNEQCNLKCTYCYGNYGQRDKYENYSTRYLLKIIDELKELGTRLLTLHGGESLLRRDIGEVINYAKLRGFYISLNTNGYLIPNKIKELICIDNIILSLDGREENNDKN